MYVNDCMILDSNAAHFCYESMEEFDKLLPTILPAKNVFVANESIWQRNSSGHKKTGFNWFGTKDAVSAMEKIKFGWPEMLKRLTDMWGDERPDLELAASTAKVRRRKRRRADYGDTLDIHRVWAGDLEHAWERPERVYRLSATQRHATIYINMGANCMENADTLLWRAAAALLVCDLLQAAGRSVEIYAGSHQEGPFVGSAYFSFGKEGPFTTSDYTPYHQYTAMRIKPFGEPLNMERLAAVANMAFYRTYGFLMIMAAPFKVTNSLGYPANDGMPIQLKRRADAGELVVTLGHCNSMYLAEQEFLKVKEALSKQHGDDEEDAA